MSKYVGVDWAKNCWLCVVIDDDEDDAFTVERQPSIHTLWTEHNDAESIFIDIPIGLPSDDEGHDELRECDKEAKARLGSNSSKVFYTPSREATQCQEWREAKEENESLLDRSISGQAWSIVPRIRELDVFLQEEDVDETRLLESHPEVVFDALADEADVELVQGKGTDAGLKQRITVLRAIAPEHVEIPEWSELKSDYEAESEPSFGRLVGKGRMDDFVDALGLSVSARLAGGSPEKIPEDPPDDARGLPMQIIYHDPSNKS